MGPDSSSSMRTEAKRKNIANLELPLKTLNALEIVEKSNKKLTAYRTSKFMLLFIFLCSIIVISAMEPIVFLAFPLERRVLEMAKEVKTGGP